MAAIGDILVIPFFGQGHLNPCVELCKHLSSFSNSKIILIIPTHLAPSIPSTLHQSHPFVEVLQIEASYSNSQPPPPESVEKGGPKLGNNPAYHHGHKQMGKEIERYLSETYKDVPAKTRPGFVVMDLMMSWSKDIFLRENIPIVSFFTSGAASTALEYAAWKAQAHDMKPGETRVLTGLPESLELRYSDIKSRRGPPGAGKPGRRGPDFGIRDPGQPPRWLDDGKDSIALLLNTCHDLEGPFLDYVANQESKPVFGVGPLLPETFWNSIGSVVHDRDSRSKRKSNYSEDEISQWLDSKPNQSVIYIAFGSEVGPNMEEYAQLAEALEESKWPFIWVIQPGSGKPGPPPMMFGGKSSSNDDEGFYPHGLEDKVGNRGIIIKGWAPQLLILSHPSTGGFLSHCGWNSTVEAMGRGVPILAWPIRGDQFYNAKLVADYLRTGAMVSSGDHLSEMVQKSDIIQGIDGLMDSREIHERANDLRGIFKSGYPSSSLDSVKALVELISKN